MAEFPPSFKDDSSLQTRGNKPSDAKAWCAHAVTFFRLFAAVLFACLAFQPVPTPLLAGIYCAAMLSDLVDGLLARRLNAKSFGGKIADLVSDKSLTIVSLLYAAERGTALPPLAIIGVREMIVLGARAISVKGSQLLPTSRFFGGTMAFLLWGNTLLLLLQRNAHNSARTTEQVYWGCAVMLSVNLVTRIYVSRTQIKGVLTNAE